MLLCAVSVLCGAVPTQHGDEALTPHTFPSRHRNQALTHSATVPIGIINDSLGNVNTSGLAFVSKPHNQVLTKSASSTVLIHNEHGDGQYVRVELIALLLGGALLVALIERAARLAYRDWCLSSRQRRSSTGKASTKPDADRGRSWAMVAWELLGPHALPQLLTTFVTVQCVVMLTLAVVRVESGNLFAHFADSGAFDAAVRTTTGHIGMRVSAAPVYPASGFFARAAGFGLVYSLLWLGMCVIPSAGLRSRPLFWPSLHYEALVGYMVGVIDSVWYMSATIFQAWALQVVSPTSTAVLRTVLVLALAAADLLFWTFIDALENFLNRVRPGSVALDGQLAWLKARDTVRVNWSGVGFFAALAVFWGLLPLHVLPLLPLRVAAVSIFVVIFDKTELLNDAGQLQCSHQTCDDDGACLASVRTHGRQWSLVHHQDEGTVSIVSGEGERVLRAFGEEAAQTSADVAVALSCRPSRVLLYADGEGLYADRVLESPLLPEGAAVTIVEPYPEAAAMIRERWLMQADSSPSLSGQICTNGVRLETLAESGFLPPHTEFDLIIVSKRLGAVESADLEAASALLAPSGLLLAYVTKQEALLQRGLPPRMHGVARRSGAVRPASLNTVHGVHLVFAKAPHAELPAALLHATPCPPILVDALSVERTSPLPTGGIAMRIEEVGARTLPEDDCAELLVTKWHHSTETAWQRIDIVDLPSYGRTLLNDNSLQSAQSDERIYHELLVHVPCVLHGNVRRVLIGGSGEMATLRELLRYPQLEEIVAVDIDEEAVRAYQAHLDEWHYGLFDHPKVRMIFDDINNVFKDPQNAERFDLLILDLCDPTQRSSPAAHLFTLEFYSAGLRTLRKGGLLVMQSGELSVHQEHCAVVRSTLLAATSCVDHYFMPVPSFYDPWFATIAGAQRYTPNRAQLEERIAAIGLDARGCPLQFYSEHAHLAVLDIPAYLKNSLERRSDPVNESLLQRIEKAAGAAGDDDGGADDGPDDASAQSSGIAPAAVDPSHYTAFLRRFEGARWARLDERRLVATDLHAHFSVQLASSAYALLCRHGDGAMRGAINDLLSESNFVVYCGSIIFNRRVLALCTGGEVVALVVLRLLPLSNTVLEVRCTADDCVHDVLDALSHSEAQDMRMTCTLRAAHATRCLSEAYIAANSGADDTESAVASDACRELEALPANELLWRRAQVNASFTGEGFAELLRLLTAAKEAPTSEGGSSSVGVESIDLTAVPFLRFRYGGRPAADGETLIDASWVGVPNRIGLCSSTALFGCADPGGKQQQQQSGASPTQALSPAQRLLLHVDLWSAKYDGDSFLAFPGFLLGVKRAAGTPPSCFELVSSCMPWDLWRWMRTGELADHDGELHQNHVWLSERAEKPSLHTVFAKRKCTHTLPADSPHTLP